MPNYKNMYFNLAAKVADVIEILIQAQQDGENAFCIEQPNIINIVKNDSDTDLD